LWLHPGARRLSLSTCNSQVNSSAPVLRRTACARRDTSEQKHRVVFLRETQKARERSHRDLQRSKIENQQPESARPDELIRSASHRTLVPPSPASRAMAR